MKGLTEKQRQVLDFIEEFTKENSMAPTVYEIGEHFKVKASTVFAHLHSLQRKNFLHRTSKARSISLYKPKQHQKVRCNGVFYIPYLGKLRLRIENRRNMSILSAGI